MDVPCEWIIDEHIHIHKLKIGCVTKVCYIEGTSLCSVNALLLITVTSLKGKYAQTSIRVHTSLLSPIPLLSPWLRYSMNQLTMSCRHTLSNPINVLAWHIRLVIVEIKRTNRKGISVWCAFTKVRLFQMYRQLAFNEFSSECGIHECH